MDDMERLEHLINAITNHKNRSYKKDLSTFSWVSCCFLNLQVKLARNLTRAVASNDFMVANILANSMCDALLQLLWMEIDKKTHVQAYKHFYLISSFSRITETEKDDILHELNSDPFYKKFLRPKKVNMSLNRDDYVNEWFQFNDGRKNFYKRNRWNLYKEWEEYMQKSNLKEDEVVKIYESYQITCDFKHFSSNITLRAFDTKNFKFIEHNFDKINALFIANMALDFTLFIVNQSQIDKVKY